METEIKRERGREWREKMGETSYMILKKWHFCVVRRQNRNSPAMPIASMHVKVGLMNDEGANHRNDTAFCYYKRP